MTGEHLKQLVAMVKPGYRIASGQATDSPYPRGSIEMQTPYFKARGLDLKNYYRGTLNLSISPHYFSIKMPDYNFKNVAWAEGFPAEDFLFVKCSIVYKNNSYSSYVYYPDPTTKIGHFQDGSTIEIISEYIEGINSGDQVTLILDLEKIDIL